MSLGKKITQFCVENNISFSEFANMIGYQGNSMIYAYVKDRRLPRVKTCIRIAKVMGISVEDLIEGKYDWKHYYEAEHGPIKKMKK